MNRPMLRAAVPLLLMSAATFAADPVARMYEHQVELVEIAGADHHVTLDNPAGFVRAMRAFLARN